MNSGVNVRKLINNDKIFCFRYISEAGAPSESDDFGLPGDLIKLSINPI